MKAQGSTGAAARTASVMATPYTVGDGCAPEGDSHVVPRVLGRTVRDRGVLLLQLVTVGTVPWLHGATGGPDDEGQYIHRPPRWGVGPLEGCRCLSSARSLPS